MKIKCNDNTGRESELTTGKVYDVKETTDNFFELENDKGVLNEYFKRRFLVSPSLDEVIKDKQNENVPHGTIEHVNHPNHYNKGKFEVIDVIEDWDLGFNLGNAIKYIGRCEHKANKVQDLEKAIWYIKREIKNHQNKLTV